MHAPAPSSPDIANMDPIFRGMALPPSCTVFMVSLSPGEDGASIRYCQVYSLWSHAPHCWQTAPIIVKEQHNEELRDSYPTRWRTPRQLLCDSLERLHTHRPKPLTLPMHQWSTHLTSNAADCNLCRVPGIGPWAMGAPATPQALVIMRPPATQPPTKTNQPD